MKQSRLDRARLVEQDLLFHETIFRALETGYAA